MNTRSQEKQFVLDPVEESKRIPDPNLIVTRPLLPQSLLNSSISVQRKHVKNSFNRWYKHQSSKDIQVNTTISLMNGLNTFLMAGTGYGKSRISEMYLQLFDPLQLPVVLVLNPLDALGDNQVNIPLLVFVNKETETVLCRFWRKQDKKLPRSI